MGESNFDINIYSFLWCRFKWKYIESITGVKKSIFIFLKEMEKVFYSFSLVLEDKKRFIKKRKEEGYFK